MNKKVEAGILVIESNLSLFIKRILGNRIRYSWLTLASAKSSIKTYETGNIYLGKRAAIRPNTEISATGGTILVGDQCFINRNCMIVSHEHIEIGNGTTIGPGVYIYDHDHDGAGGYNCKPVIIGKNVWVGSGSIILKGVVVGDNAVIGAGSIVTKNIAPNEIFFQKREEFRS